jgi:hypothetical protein
MTRSHLIPPIMVVLVIAIAGLSLAPKMLKHYRQDKQNTCSLALSSKQLQQQDRERLRETRAVEDGTDAAYEANAQKAAKYCKQRGIDLSKCKEYWDIVNKKLAINTQRIIDNLEELKHVEKESCE